MNVRKEKLEQLNKCVENLFDKGARYIKFLIEYLELDRDAKTNNEMFERVKRAYPILVFMETVGKANIELMMAMEEIMKG